MAFLQSFGHYLPSREVSNTDVAAVYGCDADWIERTSGIVTRRYASADETVVDLAVAAARAAIGVAEALPIGLLIVSSGSPGRVFPGPATAIARALGLGATPALDLSLPSVGGLVGLQLASQLASHYGRVLVVATEKMSAVVGRDGTPPQIAALFGDGAGACVVSPDSGMARILDTAWHSDGTFDTALRLDWSGPMEMDGRTVILQAARKLPMAINEVLGRRAVQAGAVSAFLLHQANQLLIDQVAKSLAVAGDRFYSNIRRYGNTSSASLLIAASEWTADAGFRRGVPTVLAAFGAGLQWGALLAEGT